MAGMCVTPPRDCDKTMLLRMGEGARLPLDGWRCDEEAVAQETLPTMATQEPTSWAVTNEALRAGDEVWAEEVPRLDIRAFTHVLEAEGMSSSRPSVINAYADSLVDLARLMEEIRFEVGTAAMLLVDFATRHPAEVESMRSRADSSSDAGIPVVVLGLLAPDFRETPPPSAIARDLHQAIGSHRHLSRWFAGQLLDGAIVRGVSCLDRLATLLKLATSHSVPQRMPGFTAATLRGLEGRFENREPLAELITLAEHELFLWVKGIRDGHIHRRRWPSALHGDGKIVYGGDQPDGQYVSTVYDGLTAQEHLGTVLAIWRELLTPAVAASGLLLSAQSPLVR